MTNDFRMATTRWGRAAHFLLLVVACSMLAQARADVVGKCNFDRQQLQFQGSAQEQSRCLLRRVAKWGIVETAPAILPASLEATIGTPATSLKTAMRKYLADGGIPEESVGGSLDAALSRANDGAANAPTARYFVIHDTSSPWLGNASVFPPDDSTSLNNLQQYAGADSVAHVFVNRLGQTLKGHDFSVPWRATKLETKVIGKPAKGLFVHVEMLQPRRRDPSGGPKNDAIAPAPGFTAAQYQKLALVYAAASVRAGTWLVPAFHAAIDEGLSDGHDDPQNFELGQFSDALEQLRKLLGANPASGGQK